MGKVSPQSIKYIINAKFSTEGVVERPDVIGAIFGQTEGLLGEELELRELQKMGKIGRINVELEVNESKTSGTIEIPTSIDKAETTIIAAAVETIDRIGPCDASFEIVSIEDVRSSKRDYILERAKKLLTKLNIATPKLKEMERDIKDHTKIAKICEYGRELLAAGPDIDASDEIIVVEGRADVLNLLRARIKNAIAMNGTVIPKTVKDLSQEKEVILFVDGDRGGVLIAKDAIENAKIDFIARAPDGKEVEELTEKEIIICLRSKMKVDEFEERYMKRARKGGRKTEKARSTRKKVQRKQVREQAEKAGKSTEDIEKTLKEYFSQLNAGQSILLLGTTSDFREKPIGGSEIVNALYNAKKRNNSVLALITKTTITPRIMRVAEQADCKYIVAKNFSTTSEKIILLSF